MPDHGHSLAGSDAERQVAQHRLAGLVGKGDSRELDLTAHRLRAEGLRRRGDRHRRVEEREDPLGARHGTLQDIELLGKVGERLIEALRILQEGNQRPDRDRLGDHPTAAVPDNEAGAEGGDQLDPGVVDGVVEDSAQVGLTMGVVGTRKVRVGSRLAYEQLEHRHAGDVLLQEGVDRRDPCAHLAEAVASPALEPQGQEQKQRQDREGDHRQSPVEPEEHAHDAEEDRDVAADRHQPGGEELVERVDVTGDSRHQAAQRVAIEIRHGEPLEVPEEVAPEIEHDLLTHHLHDVALGVENNEAEVRATR